MELFVTLIYACTPLTSVTKSSILDAAEVLDTPLDAPLGLQGKHRCFTSKHSETYKNKN